MSRRVTQRDIARMTGVSQATVSLVLNNRTGDDVRIAPETRQRVLDAIRTTGYVADPVARRLVSGRNRILGVFTYEPVFPSTAADFYHPFLVGIEQRAEQLGCDLLLFTSSGQAAGTAGQAAGTAGQAAGAAKAVGRRIFHTDSRIGIADGTILLGRRVDRDDLFRLVGEGHAFVSVGRRDDAGGPVPYVGADYPAAVAALVERAAGLGHTRVGYLGTGGPAESHADRLRGFHAAGGANELRVHLPPQHQQQQQQQQQQRQQQRTWLDAIARERLTAVFLEEHADAAALIEAARARGLSVPGDLSVVALGEPSGAGPLDEAITRLRIPRREMGWQAVEQLTATIAAGGATAASSAAQRLLPCTIHAGVTLVSRS